MSVQNPKTGVFAFSYYNSGTFNSPTWVAISSLRDNDLIDELKMADSTIRADGGLESVLDATRKIGIQGQLLWYPSATDFAALHTAYLARTAQEYLCLDGPSTANTGSQGPRFTGLITKFPRKEALADSLVSDFEVLRTISSNATSWYSA